MATEKRLIDANTLKAEFTGNFHEMWHYTGIRAMIDVAPTVDAVEVVHGYWHEFTYSAFVRWKDGEPVWADRSVFRCSRCDFGTIAKHNYCPRCGAKMDKNENP